MAALLIVGNGPSADSPGVARAIAQAGWVLRINGFKAGQHIGTRCDIWGSMLDHGWVAPPSDAQQVWWSAHPFCPNQYPELAYVDAVGCPPTPYTRIASEALVQTLNAYFAPKSPSTGIILIAMALEDPAWETVMIAGFDNFKPGTVLHYVAPELEVSEYWRAAKSIVASEWHCPTLEAEYIRQRCQEGRLKILHENSDPGPDKSDGERACGGQEFSNNSGAPSVCVAPDRTVGLAVCSSHLR